MWISFWWTQMSTCWWEELNVAEGCFHHMWKPTSRTMIAKMLHHGSQCAHCHKRKISLWFLFHFLPYVVYSLDTMKATKGKDILKGKEKDVVWWVTILKTKKKHYVGKFVNLLIEDKLHMLFKYDGGSRRNGKQEAHHSSSAHAWNNFAIWFT